MISIITGGQTGVDTGALRAARDEGVLHQALFPANFKRESPPEPWLKACGTCIESDKYDVRTREVIRKAQACLIISPSLEDSPGTALTYRLAKDEGMQLWVFQHALDQAYWKAEAHAMAHWLLNIEATYDKPLLMVAGPRAKKWDRGENNTVFIVQMMLKELKAIRPPKGKK